MPTEQSTEAVEKSTIDLEAADLSSVKVVLTACIMALRKQPPSRELALAATNAQQARMWIEEHQANA